MDTHVSLVLDLETYYSSQGWKFSELAKPSLNFRDNRRFYVCQITTNRAEEPGAWWLYAGSCSQSSTQCSQACIDLAALTFRSRLLVRRHPPRLTMRYAHQLRQSCAEVNEQNRPVTWCRGAVDRAICLLATLTGLQTHVYMTVNIQLSSFISIYVYVAICSARKGRLYLEMLLKSRILSELYTGFSD